MITAAIPLTVFSLLLISISVNADFQEIKFKNCSKLFSYRFKNEHLIKWGMRKFQKNYPKNRKSVSQIYELCHAIRQNPLIFNLIIGEGNYLTQAISSFFLEINQLLLLLTPLESVFNIIRVEVNGCVGLADRHCAFKKGTTPLLRIEFVPSKSFFSNISICSSLISQSDYLMGKSNSNHNLTTA